MRARLRFAAASLVSPWLLPVAAVVEAANLVQRGRPWVGEGMWTVEWVSIAMFLLAPVICGACALDAARASRRGAIHLSACSRAPSRVFLRAWLWGTVPTIGVHLLALVVALAMGRVTSPSVGWLPLLLEVVIQCLVLLWFGAVGSAIGRLTGPVVAGLGGATGALALLYTLGDSVSGERFSPLALGSATVSQLGLAYDRGYALSQVAVLLLSGAAVLNLTTRSFRAFRIPAARGLVAIGVAASTVAAASSTLPTHRLVARPEAPTRCSTSDTVELCLFGEHRRFEREARARIGTLVRAARSAHYDGLVPDRVVESSQTFRGGGPRTASLTLPLDGAPTTTSGLEEWASELTRPTHCPQLVSDRGPGDDYVHKQMLLEVTWLHLVGVRSSLLDFFDDLRVVSPAEAATIVADLRACRFGGR